MRYFKLIPIVLLLSVNAFAGSESANIHVDLSACAEEDMHLKVNCEHWDYVTDEVVLCHARASLPEKLIIAGVNGDSYLGVQGLCNGRIRTCVYHFKPSKMLNVHYPSEIYTSFPDGQTLTTPLIKDQLPYLKVECK